MNSMPPPAPPPLTITIAGGSGFLGQALTTRLRNDGHHVQTLTRRPRPGVATDLPWTPDGTAGPWAATLASTDVLVNLAGESIAGRRWTTARKHALRESRLLSTRSLAHALDAAPPRPRLLISGSAVGIYGARGGEPVTEATPAGSDFLARLAVEWESEAARAVSAQTAVALIRTGIVLHPAGGALRSMLLPFRMGVGGPMGTGRQYMPWIHLQDWVALITHVIRRGTGVTGEQQGGNPSVTAWNATAPAPVTNRTFSRTLGRVLARPAVLPAPAFALRMALGEMSVIVLTGARVLPEQALASGFRFAFPELEAALRNLLDRR